MARVLVTGFEPFLGDRVNPSELLLRELNTDPKWRGKIRMRLLPVSFARSVEILNAELDGAEDSLAFVLMLGLASTRDHVSLERVALNWDESTSPDQDGVTAKTGPVEVGSEDAYFSDLPLAEWAEAISQAGTPCKVSMSAGGYVCNHLSYKISKRLAGTPVRALFVHVPCTPEMAKGRPNLPMADTKRAIDMILQEMCGPQR